MTRRRTRNPSALMKREYRTLDAILPRQELLVILRQQSDERFQRLADIMLSHASAQPKALVTMVLDAGLTYAELTTAIINSFRTESLLRSSKQLPDILEDMAIDARSRDDLCPKCKGSGIDAADNGKCPECSGRGTIRVIGDSQSRAHLLKAHDMISGDRGTSVTVNPTTVVGVPSLASLVGRADKALKPPPITAEAEVVEDKA